MHQETIKKILDLLTSHSKTTHEASRYIMLLKSYLEAEYFNSPLDLNELNDAEKAWIKTLGEENISQTISKDSLGEILKEVKSAVEKIDILVLFTAVELTTEGYNEVIKKVRSLTNKHLLIDFRLDPTLVAGCSLIWKGVYKDYSLKSRIEKNRDLILSQFKAYINTYA